MKFKKTHKDAVAPKKANPGDAGWDLVAVTKNKVYNKNLGYLEYIEYGIGLSFELPEGTVGLLFPRSSISTMNLALSNSVGVLDASFRGSVSFRFRQLNSGSFGEYSVGDRVGQLVVVDLKNEDMEEATELTDTERGEGGYGSSNKKETSQAW